MGLKNNKHIDNKVNWGNASLNYHQCRSIQIQRLTLVINQEEKKRCVSFRFSPNLLAKKCHNFQQGEDYHAAEYQPLSFWNISEQ
jgi:hypothetical protein